MVRKSPAMGKYGMLPSDIWVPESTIKYQLYDSAKTQQPQQMYYLDIPYAFRRTIEGETLLRELNVFEDKAIFKLKSVQILIDYHYSYWQIVQWYSVGIPMVFQLIVFWYWSNIVIVNIETDPIDFERQEIFCRYALLASAAYLLAIELTAIFKKNIFYLDSITNVFNLVTPCLVMWNLWRNDREKG